MFSLPASVRSSSRAPIASGKLTSSTPSFFLLGTPSSPSASRLLASSSSRASTSTPSRTFFSSSSSHQEAEAATYEREEVPFRGPKFVGRRTPEERAKIPAWQLKREDEIMKDDINRNLETLGSYQTDTEWSPVTPSQNPPSAFEVSVSHLVAAGTHMGHNPRITQTAWHPYLAGRRAGMDIINVEHTLPSLRKACGVVRDLVRDDGVVVFVGRKKAVKLPIMKAVDRLGGCGHAVTNKWIPGTLTNAHVMYGPDVVLSGAQRPDLVILLDPSRQMHILRECNNMVIPTMAITDTDVDPRMVTFPILGNLDSSRSTELLLGAIGRAGEEGILARKGRTPGAPLTIVPGAFQAKITDHKNPDRMAGRQKDPETWVLPRNEAVGLEREERGAAGSTMGAQRRRG